MGRYRDTRARNKSGHGEWRFLAERSATSYRWLAGATIRFVVVTSGKQQSTGTMHGYPACWGYGKRERADVGGLLVSCLAANLGHLWTLSKESKELEEGIEMLQMKIYLEERMKEMLLK